MLIKFSMLRKLPIMQPLNRLLSGDCTLCVYTHRLKHLVYRLFYKAVYKWQDKWIIKCNPDNKYIVALASNCIM